jgi:hypothetical protein
MTCENLQHDPNWWLLVRSGISWIGKKFRSLTPRHQLMIAALLSMPFMTTHGLSTPVPVPADGALSQPAMATNKSIDPIPMLAYYYIWFDVKSWDRAKTDLPILGRYSSDDADVMRQHIQWAKEAGIDGFIVSWKGTEKLNQRLDQLVEIADEENFKLAIIYQGLDFERNPLTPEQVDADLNYFIDRYATNPVFDIFGKPMVIWSGSWKFSALEIQKVAESKRDRVLILATEKNLEGYQRIANLVDGDAYYWSSVNPATHPGYAEKLIEMGKVVHDNGGLWIAPAAVGFDARLIGGTTIVERQDGETLRIELDTAIQSAPDAIGLISWNEFSENSHIEPSLAYGKRYLQVLTEVQAVSTPKIFDFDSSAPQGINLSNAGSPFVALFSISALITISLLIIIIRVNRNNKRKI